MRTAGARSYKAYPTRLQTHMADQVDTRIAGKTFATDGPLYTTITHNDAGPFVRNPTFWASDVDLTCISPSNSTGSAQRAGVAITKRHVLYCKHSAFYPADGASVRFCTMADAAVAKTQSKHFELANDDMAVGVLDSDLPGTITPCPVAPDNLLNYINYFPYIPVMALDAEEKGIVKELDHIFHSELYTKNPLEPQRLAFNETLVGGDSGDPVFLMINGQLVLIGTVTDADIMACPVGINSRLNAAIVSVDTLNGDLTGYTVTNPNLSAFG